MKFWKYLFAFIGLLLACSAAIGAEPRLVNIPAMPDSKLLHKVQPGYPADALALHVQGTVKLRVTIAENGKIIGARVLSGHPLLKAAALQSVRQWVYQPTMIGGVAVRVVTEVSIPFALDRDGRPVVPSESPFAQ